MGARRRTGPAGRCSTPPGGAPRRGSTARRRPGCTGSPGRSTTTIVERPTTSSWRSHVARPAAASSPTIVNSVAAGLPIGQGGQRVGGEAGAAELDLQAPGLQARHVGDGGLDHRQAVGGRRDRPAGLLLPGDVGHHQHDDVQVEGVADVHGGDQVAHVRRVERPPEQADRGGVLTGRTGRSPAQRRSAIPAMARRRSLRVQRRDTGYHRFDPLDMPGTVKCPPHSIPQAGIRGRPQVRTSRTRRSPDVARDLARAPRVSVGTVPDPNLRTHHERLKPHHHERLDRPVPERHRQGPAPHRRGRAGALAGDRGRPGGR